MTRSTCWSLLAFSMALMSYTMHRDISANVFLGVVFIIQGMKQHNDIETAAQWGKIALLCTTISAVIIILALYTYATGIQWARPKPW